MGLEAVLDGREREALELLRERAGRWAEWLMTGFWEEDVDDPEGFLDWYRNLKPTDADFLPQIVVYIESLREIRELISQEDFKTALYLALVRLPDVRQWRAGRLYGHAPRKGGRASSRRLGIEAATRRLLRKAEAEGRRSTARSLWESFPVDPDSLRVRVGEQVFVVCRVRKELEETEDRSGQVKSITFRSFQRYLTKIKKKSQ